jgi:hypothetical protein
MSLLHALLSAFALCFAIFSTWRPQVLIGGAGPEADLKRTIVRFCGLVVVAATAVEAGIALFA